MHVCSPFKPTCTWIHLFNIHIENLDSYLILLGRWFCMENFHNYLIGIIKSHRIPECSLAKKKVLTLMHTHASCSTFFFIRYYARIKSLHNIGVKMSCYAKFYLWAFMWKRRFFIAPTIFHCMRERDSE